MNMVNAGDWIPPAASRLKAADSEAARFRLEQLQESHAYHVGSSDGAFWDLLESRDEVRALVNCVLGGSPFLSQCAVSEPQFAAELFCTGPDASLANVLAEVESDGYHRSPRRTLMTSLRKAKRRAALAIAVADISTAWSLSEVTLSLSDFAEACVQVCVSHLLHARHRKGDLNLPDPDMPQTGSGLIILGMGKFGAYELNYSSDIDIIALYDEDRCPCGFGEARGIYSALVRNLVAMMGKRTADGYVFRTDIRLRPDIGTRAAALSTESALEYYRTVGQNWERAAMIKARSVAGDTVAASEFLDANQGFAWRKHLDFASLQGIQSIKHKINVFKGGDTVSVPGRNLKLGRGGIREIEFYAQAQQLIWGGQSPHLRCRGTIEALRRLVTAGRISHEAARTLGEAYEFLRRAEHRLQMVDDQQTHSLPVTDAGLDKIALFLGFDTREAFTRTLLMHLQAVETTYDDVFVDRQKLAGTVHLDLDDDEIVATLSDLGFHQPERVVHILNRWKLARHRSIRNTLAHSELMALAPDIIAAFAAAPVPDRAIMRFDDFIARTASGVELFAMISARPDLLNLIARIMGTAPFLAEWLNRHPRLLESVLQKDFEDLSIPEDSGLEPELEAKARAGLVRLFYASEFGKDQMRLDMIREIKAQGGEEDFQNLLNAQRGWARARKFQAGVHTLGGHLTPVDAGQPLCRIAETCIEYLVPVVRQGVEAEFGRIAGGEIAVIAFGRLGSQEMTISSDLDLIFVYDHDPAAYESDGPRQIAPTMYFARLFRRFINALTAQTPEGRLYEVDMRLRPSGKSGPIAVSLAAFESYQMEKAWTWEYQALTRARVVFASGGLGPRLANIIRGALRSNRKRESLGEDVVSMRHRMRREFGKVGPWSIKHMRGGLIDVEFVAQYLQLLHAPETGDILQRDALSVFRKAREHALLERTVADDLAEATVLWRNLHGMLLLADGKAGNSREVEDSLKFLVGRTGHDAVFERFGKNVRDIARRTSLYFDEIIRS